MAERVQSPFVAILTNLTTKEDDASRSPLLSFCNLKYHAFLFFSDSPSWIQVVNLGKTALFVWAWEVSISISSRPQNWRRFIPRNSRWKEVLKATSISCFFKYYIFEFVIHQIFLPCKVVPIVVISKILAQDYCFMVKYSWWNPRAYFNVFTGQRSSGEAGRRPSKDRGSGSGHHRERGSSGVTRWVLLEVQLPYDPSHLSVGHLVGP